MITNATFGERFGRLGNQLFQLGLLFAIRERHGHDFYLPRRGESLWECFDLDVSADGPECTHEFHEVHGSCNYDPSVFEQPDGTSYHGYFQSYRYLEHCRESLTRCLRFNVKHRGPSEALLFGYRRRYGRPLVSVHVRRGDIVEPRMENHWGNLAKDGYYERAVAAVGDDVTYLVFSDDLEWCRQSLALERAAFVAVDHFTALRMMTGCDVNIVANSTFSWWGSYLNPTADVYAPSRWFGPSRRPPNDRQDDILLPEWRTIPVYGDVETIADR